MKMDMDLLSATPSVDDDCSSSAEKPEEMFAQSHERVSVGKSGEVFDVDRSVEKSLKSEALSAADSSTSSEVFEGEVEKSGTTRIGKAGEKALESIRKDRAKSVHFASMNESVPSGNKCFKTLRVKKISEEATWASIVSQPTPPSAPSTLGQRWEDSELQLTKRGKIQVIQEPIKAPSRPVWVADVDKSRAYRSLSTRVEVADVNGVKKAFQMVVDTGSCVTLVSDRVYTDVGSPPLFKPDHQINLHDANGQPLKVRGLFEMKTWFGDQVVYVDALVIRNLAPSLLLGMDFLHKTQALVDLEMMELRMPHMRPIKLSCGPPGQCRLGKTIRLQPKEAAQGAPSTFQRAMDLLMTGLRGISMLVYIDDVIIFSRSYDEHVEHVGEVCQRLFDAGRNVKMSKVRWAMEEVDFLGFRVGKGCVTPRADKVQIVLDIHRPESIEAAQSFLGAAGVYRKFIADFATLADPIYSFVATDDQDQWNSKCEQSFQNLKIALVNMAGLELPKGSAEQAIQLDGDRRGFGAVFLQRSGPGFPWKPVQFLSGVHRGGDSKRSGPERTVIAVGRLLKKLRSMITQGPVLHVFTEEPVVDWALDVSMVSGRAQKAALLVSTFNLKWGRASGKYQRFGGLFSYNSPELEARKLAAERRKVECQQRRVTLNDFTACSIEDAWVAIFDGGYRQKPNIGGFGWSVWDVVDNVWTLKAAEGVPNLGKTTVNLEEFAGLEGVLKFMSSLPSREAHVFGDSSLVVGAMQQKIQCRSDSMKTAYNAVLKQVDKFVVVPSFWQVSRDFNEAADWMANLAMDQRETQTVVDQDSIIGQQLVKCHGVSLHERIYMTPVIVPRTATPRHVNVVTRARQKLITAQSDVQGRLMPWVRLRHSQLATPWMKSYINWLEDQCVVEHSTELPVDHFEMHEGVLWLTSTRPDEDWRLVVPPLARPDVLAKFHEGRIGGHLKGQRFLQRMRERFYWPAIGKDVRHYETTCKACQLVKGRLGKWEVPLSTLSEVTLKPFQTVAVDSVVNLPETSNGFKHMVVLVCYFSRYPIAIPVKDLSLQTFVEVVMTHLITEHGCPERLVSDKGGQFVGKLAHALYRYMRIRKQATSAYHPQANGLCERMNGTIVQGLKTMAEDHPEDWDKELPWFLLAYRTTMHSVTQCTPFELVHARSARLPSDVMMRQYHEGGLKLAIRT